jgi:hypothetical protein
MSQRSDKILQGFSVEICRVGMNRIIPHRIPLAGFVPLEKLLEINRDAIRATPKNERKDVCEALIYEAIVWSSYSHNEAIGALEMAKQKILLLALADEEIKSKRRRTK